MRGKVKKGSRQKSKRTVLAVVLGTLLCATLVPSAAWAQIGRFEGIAENHMDLLIASVRDWHESDLPEWSGSAAGVEPTEGEGTAENPYLVATADELRWCLVNQKSARLVSDIDLGGRQERNWSGIVIDQPILLDGAGHTIFNVYSVRNGLNGFIEKLNCATAQIVNVNFEKVAIHTFWDNVVNENSGASGPGHSLIANLSAGQIKQCAITDIYVQSYGAGSWGCGVFANIYCDNMSEGDILIEDVHIDHGLTRSYPGAAGFMYFYGDPHKGNVTVRNCSTVNVNVAYYGAGGGGHAGFVSNINMADGFEATFENCFAANTISGGGAHHSGGFVGRVTKGKATFRNCFSAGKLYGSSMAGGFLGTDEGGTATFENCYSVTNVNTDFWRAGTMQQMASFAGVPGDSTAFKNCYAAGEMGWLAAGPGGQVGSSDGRGLSTNNAKGFSHSEAGTYENCYYDKQTTAMCENGIVEGKIEGLLTRDMVDLDLGDAFVKGTGYPQLKVFVESDNLAVRAWSAATTSTALLYVNPANADDYDTVRSVRRGFSLTGDAARAAGSVSWQFHEGLNPTAPYENVTHALKEDDPILDLRGGEVVSVSPGVAMLEANVSFEGGRAQRLMRFVPGTGTVEALGDRTILADMPDKPEGMVEPSDEGLLFYDVRKDLRFVSATPFALYQIQGAAKVADPEKRLQQLGGSVESFPVTDEGQMQADGTLKLAIDGRDSTLFVAIAKKRGETWEPVAWNDSLVRLFEGGRRATPAEVGTYRFTYTVTSADGTVREREFARNLDVVEPAWVRYIWNDGKHTSSNAASDRHKVYRIDPGCYLPGATLGDALAALPMDGGKTALCWAYSRRGDFGDGQQARDALTASTPLQPGLNEVYAIWRVPEEVEPRHDRYTTLVTPDGSPIEPDDLEDWARGRYDLSDDAVIGEIVITTPSGEPVDAIDPTKPGNYVVHVTIEDDGEGNYGVVDVDWAVGLPPIVAVKPQDGEDPDRPLEPTATGEDAKAGVVYAQVSDTVTYPTQKGVTETQASLEDWARKRYRIPDDCTLALTGIVTAAGRTVTSVDKSAEGSYRLSFAITDLRGNFTTLDVTYTLRETPVVKPLDPDNSELVEKDPVEAGDDRAHKVLEEKVPIEIGSKEVDSDSGVLDQDDVMRDVQERYDLDGAEKVEIEITAPDGKRVDGIDTTVPGTYRVKVTLTGPDGDTTVLHLRYIVREVDKELDGMGGLKNDGEDGADRHSRIILARTGDEMSVMIRSTALVVLIAVAAFFVARRRLRRR